MLELFKSQKRWEKFAELQSSSLEFIEDDTQKLEWAHSAISVYSNKLNRPQSALHSAQIASELSNDIKDKVIYSETLRLNDDIEKAETCLLYTSPSPRDQRGSRMPSSA